ncbi:unnamed protein product [Arctogadus glacialis]
MEGRECVEKPIESQRNHDAENGSPPPGTSSVERLLSDDAGLPEPTDMRRNDEYYPVPGEEKSPDGPSYGVPGREPKKIPDEKILNELLCSATESERTGGRVCIDGDAVGPRLRGRRRNSDAPHGLSVQPLSHSIRACGSPCPEFSPGC